MVHDTHTRRRRSLSTHHRILLDVWFWQRGEPTLVPLQGSPGCAIVENFDARLSVSAPYASAVSIHLSLSVKLSTRLIAMRYHMLNVIALKLQLYKTLKITLVSFLWDTV